MSNCSDCRFWVPGERVIGECHRFPKMECTPGDYWCGEHSPHPDHNPHATGDEGEHFTEA